jgi:hypothetical protein
MENNQSKSFPKRGRGRPKVFDSQMEAVLKGSFSDKTQRGLQNKFYLLRAFRLVKNDPALRWLYDKEAETIQSTILAELGRIDRDEDLLIMARQICVLRPKARDAILLIRTCRKSKRAITQPAFEEYCRERWDMARRTAYQFIEAAKVVKNLCAIEHKPTHESQLRPLTHLEPEQQPTAWKKAVETAPMGVKPTSENLSPTGDNVNHGLQNPTSENLSTIEDKTTSKMEEPKEDQGVIWDYFAPAPKI